MALARRSTIHRQPVVIVGASAAGLHAAYLLAKGGVPVYLFDERERLGPPARTLIVTSRMRDALGCIPSDAIVNQTSNLQLLSPGCSTTIRLSQPDWVVERERLMHMLARQARGAGAEFLPGYRFVGLEPDGDGVLVNLECLHSGQMERVRTRILIGADGAASQVARAAQRDTHETVFNLQATVALPAGASSDTTQVWFDPGSTRYFYWLIPESRQRAAVGLIADDEGQARTSLTRFLCRENLEPLSYQGAEVPLYRRNALPWRRLGGAQVFLVGDAAAQVKVTTVGGLVSGLRGATAVARAILRGSHYGCELGALHRELEGHLAVRRILHRFGPRDYDALLDMLNARTKRILATRSRDEAIRVLISSLLAQPGFALLATRCLFRRDSSCSLN